MNPVIDLTMQALGFATAAVIFWRAESVLNLMNRDCMLAIRLSFWFMVVGTASLSVAILRGYIPSLEVLLILAGLALLLVAERRIGAILRIHTTVPFERRSRR